MEEILINLISYTAIHFKTEEQYFDLYGCPQKETHKAEHKKFVETATKFKKDIDSGNATISLVLCLTVSYSIHFVQNRHELKYF